MTGTDKLSKTPIRSQCYINYETKLTVNSHIMIIPEEHGYCIGKQVDCVQRAKHGTVVITI